MSETDLTLTFRSLFSLGPCVDNVCDKPTDRKWVECTSLLLHCIAAFSRSTFQNVSDNAVDPKVSEIHLSLSWTESLSFPCQLLTMFFTLWLMERRMSSPLLSTKLSLRSLTTEVRSTANTRHSSDMLRTCLSIWKVARNRSSHYLREWYDNFDVIVCSFCFWCFALLKARKTIIFEPFVEWQKRFKRVEAFATDSEPFKGSSDWYTMQKTVWNTFCCRFSHISEKVFSEVFAIFYKRGQGSWAVALS